MLDFATRAYNHSFHIDPVIRSLLDTDFYKLTMLQFIHYSRHRSKMVTFKMTNRTKKVRIAKDIPVEVLRAHLDHVKSLRFENAELVWLAGNMFYSMFQLFKQEFIEFLRTFRLPDYNLSVDENDQFVLTFTGTWEEVSLWEIYALAIVNELRYRSKMQQMSKFELDIMYSKAKTKLWDKLVRLRDENVAGIADFGTRRRHSFLWQEWAVQAAEEALGKNFIGTSNTLIAMKHGYEAIGTNAHELVQVYATVASDEPETLRKSQYEVLADWQDIYGPALRVFLPDTFGTTQFLKNAPEFLLDWVGSRVDSKDPIRAGYEMIDWYKSHGVDPREKRILFSDGLDVDQMIKYRNEFHDKMRVGFGWGTNLTNDFRDCAPVAADDYMDPISLVCKVSEVNRRRSVKLSDNYEKATGDKDVIEYYREVFGVEGMDNLPVTV